MLYLLIDKNIFTFYKFFILLTNNFSILYTFYNTFDIVLLLLCSTPKRVLLLF